MTSPVAHTPSGALVGVRDGPVVRYRGVPFTAAPTGPRRWAPPADPPSWTGSRDATRHGPLCPQLRTRLSAAVGDIPGEQDEDCLTLTITAPAADRGGRPVIVWLHGGGYSSGAGSLDWYDGAALAAAGSVVVGVNHRLGPLGYWRHPGGGDGRAGLDDVLAALRWVRTHITAFGGDPDAVTVLGQSAGAHAVLCVLAAPAERRLFRRAVLLSPPAGLAPLTSAQADEIDREYTALVAELLPDGAAVLDAPAGVLLTAAGTLARRHARPGDVAPPFLPVVDEAGPDLVALAARGAASDGIDLVVGTARDEAASLQPDLGPAEGAAVTESVFAGPVRRFADLATGGGSPVWTYRVDWAPTGRWGAAHCVELPLVFGTTAAWSRAPMIGPPDPAAEPLGAAVRSALTSFAAEGDPGRHWPRHSPGDGPGAVLDLGWPPSTTTI